MILVIYKSYIFFIKKILNEKNKLILQFRLKFIRKIKIY